MSGRVDVALCLGLLIASNACCETEPSSSHEPTLRALDSSRSRAEFEIKVLWLVHVHGRFDEVYGSISLDPFHGTARVDASIRANRVTMRIHSHEDWVKSAEFFDVQHFPEIHFVSDAFPLARLDGGGALNGDLTVRGISKHVHFDILPSACRGHAASACAVQVEGSIQRSEFGMRSRRNTLGDAVDLNFSIFVTADDASSLP